MYKDAPFANRQPANHSFGQTMPITAKSGTNGLSIATQAAPQQSMNRGHIQSRPNVYNYTLYMKHQTRRTKRAQTGKVR